MYSLTAQEGSLLALGILAVATVLVLGVYLGFPRALRTVSAIVACPTIGRRARAELVRDEWTLGFVDVTRCSVLGQHGVVFCRKGCLRVDNVDCLGRG
jgi:hypothetical protein